MSSIYEASDSDQWFTPRWLRDLAHEVLGPIELDPCTSRRNPLRARRYFTARGLAQPWRADSLWLNPPYGRDIGAWLERLQSSHVSRALALVPARPGAGWYVRATGRDRGACQLLCELHGRVRFEILDGSLAPHPARWASALLYWGPDPKRVAEQLADHGLVRFCRKVRSRSVRPIPSGSSRDSLASTPETGGGKIFRLVQNP